MKNIIEIKNLSYNYGSNHIYKDLNLDIKESLVFGILGKNGVGKSTLINILMGYIKPKSGSCKILNQDSHNLSNEIKQEIALLHEGFVSYDYMSIEEIEQFFAPFYPKWKKNYFYDLVNLMKLENKQKLSTLSFGQKSQVVLGLLFAQDAKLLILDDYSMGLDAGYRKLFIEYLKSYIKDTNKTVLITSHVMSDLSTLIDEMIIIQKGGLVHKEKMQDFLQNFRAYQIDDKSIETSLTYHSKQTFNNIDTIFTFQEYPDLKEIDCTFEDKFLGFVGMY